MKFIKSLNLKLFIAVFIVSSVCLIVFMLWNKTQKDEVFEATKLLETKLLPSSLTSQIKEESYLLVYLSSGCEACKEELKLITELQKHTEIKIFGVMGEKETVVKNYIADNHIKFPVLSDNQAETLQILELEFFPANLKIVNGKIKKAYLGVPKTKEKLLELALN